MEARKRQKIARQAARDLRDLNRKRRVLGAWNQWTADLNATPPASNSTPVITNARLRANVAARPAPSSSSDDDEPPDPPRRRPLRYAHPFFPDAHVQPVVDHRAAAAMEEAAGDEDAEDVVFVDEVHNPAPFLPLHRASGGAPSNSLGGHQPEEIWLESDGERAISTDQSGEPTSAGERLLRSLTKEVAQERANGDDETPQQLGDFAVVLDDANVLLRRRVNDADVRVRFTINDSLSQSVEIGTPISVPELEVEVANAAGRLFFKLELQNDANRHFDFLIRESLVLRPPVVGECIDELKRKALVAYTKHTSYAVTKHYRLFLVAEIGLTSEFCRQLVVFATNYEHKLYIRSLEATRDIVAAFLPTA
ncbi:hypothetical protein M3Y99_01677300 [Aphelenchoides fujianensis]|nr:hypothetical protein M3Y99_01677300 [Aphelenchoides fujianensis]